jgi:hypothetical protein
MGAEVSGTNNVNNSNKAGLEALRKKVNGGIPKVEIDTWYDKDGNLVKVKVSRSEKESVLLVHRKLKEPILSHVKKAPSGMPLEEYAVIEDENQNGKPDPEENCLYLVKGGSKNHKYFKFIEAKDQYLCREGKPLECPTRLKK